MCWSLHLFGDFKLKALPNGEIVVPPGKRERVLLAYLALSPNCRTSRRKLVSLLWGEDTDATTDNLRTCIWNLRKALGDTNHRLISSEGRDIALDASLFEVDVLAFRRLAAQPGTTELEVAASLYTGNVLEGLSIESEEFESWRREEATRSKNQALDVLMRLVTQFSEAGEVERAVDAGLRMLRIEPLHEAAVRNLMRLYGKSGRRATAVQLYRTLAESLRKELGAQPELETRALYAELSRGEEPLRFAHQSDEPRHSTPAAKSVSATGATEHVRPNARRFGWISAGGLAAAVLVIFLVYQLYPLAGDTGAPGQIESEASGDTTIAIVVLPFANLSGDASEDYLADGMTEEITSALARVRRLTVLARTSALEFRGQSRDVRAIGEAIGARYLIEGSVRKAGDRLRISAQLIEQASGANVWTGNYDRPLVDLFRTQEEIARAIAASLRAPLGLGASEALVSYRPADNDTYELFLRGRSAFRARNPEAVRFLEQVVASDPNFAPGWTLLAQSLNMVMTGRVVRGEVSRDAAEVIEARARAEAYANMAIALAPDHAESYVILANMNMAEGKWQDAMDDLRQALARDPYAPEILNNYRNLLRALGYLKEALEVSERLNLVEPLLLIYQRLRAEVVAANGMTDKGVTEYLRAGGGTRVGDLQFLMPAYAELGRFTDAVEAMSEGGNRLRLTSGPFAEPLVEAATEVLRAAANKSEPPSPLPDFEGALSAVYLYTNTPERMLEFMERDVKYGATRSGYGFLRAMWWPMPSSLRKTERFKALVRDAGLVDYWRARGWPDLCRPVGSDDFACE